MNYVKLIIDSYDNKNKEKYSSLYYNKKLIIDSNFNSIIIDTYRESFLCAYHEEVFSSHLKIWCFEDKFHRNNDLPAVIYLSGTKYWYKNGKIHRDGDLPAVILIGGRQEWYKNGKLHRDCDLPAIIEMINDSKYWYKNGKLHRDGDLPSVINMFNNSKYWYKHGKLHRYSADKNNLLLPAVLIDSEIKYYYINGYRVEEKFSKDNNFLKNMHIHLFLISSAINPAFIIAYPISQLLSNCIFGSLFEYYYGNSLINGCRSALDRFKMIFTCPENIEKDIKENIEFDHV